MAKSNVLPNEVTPLGVAEIQLMLLPMAADDKLKWPGNTAVAAKGSDVQARACKLLQGHGLPGDVGYNKTSYFFKLDDGRKVSVARHVYKDGPLVVIRVSKSGCELKADRLAELAEIENYRLNAKRQEQEKAERMAEAKGYCASQDYFRERMRWTIRDLESFITEGNISLLIDRTDPATYRLDCDERAMQLFTQLKAIVTNCMVKPVRSLRLVSA